VAYGPAIAYDYSRHTSPPPEPFLGAFGEKLRKQREQRNIALDAISNTTKISTRMLRALEDEHFDQLPGGVFNKGFVRAYARQVGLDEEEAVSDYLAALRESQIQQQSILPDFHAPAMKPAAPPQLRQQDFPKPDLPKNNAVRDDSRRNDLRTNDLRRNDSHKDDPRRKEEDRAPEPRRDQNQNISFPDSAARTPANPSVSRFRQKYPAGNPAPHPNKSGAQIPFGKLAAALLLITLVITSWNFRRHREPDPAASHAAASNHSPAPVSAPPSTEKLPSPAPPAAKKTSAPAAQPAEAISTTTKSTGSVTALPAPSRPSAPANSSPNRLSANSPAAAANPAPKIPPTHAAKPPAIFTLLIRAEKTTWVSITADGNPVAEETLIAPAHTSVHATREVVVKTRNAAGISFLLNGREIPVQGSEGEAKTFIFNASTVRVLPQAQAPTANR
jgi:cytoskeletal protein RodZ